jgi:hypothetical protein
MQIPVTDPLYTMALIQNISKTHNFDFGLSTYPTGFYLNVYFFVGYAKNNLYFFIKFLGPFLTVISLIPLSLILKKYNFHLFSIIAGLLVFIGSFIINWYGSLTLASGYGLLISLIMVLVLSDFNHNSIMLAFILCAGGTIIHPFTGGSFFIVGLIGCLFFSKKIPFKKLFLMIFFSVTIFGLLLYPYLKTLSDFTIDEYNIPHFKMNDFYSFEPKNSTNTRSITYYESYQGRNDVISIYDNDNQSSTIINFDFNQESRQLNEGTIHFSIYFENSSQYISFIYKAMHPETFLIEHHIILTHFSNSSWSIENYLTEVNKWYDIEFRWQNSYMYVYIDDNLASTTSMTSRPLYFVIFTDGASAFPNASILISDFSFSWEVKPVFNPPTIAFSDKFDLIIKTTISEIKTYGIPPIYYLFLIFSFFGRKSHPELFFFSIFTSVGALLYALNPIVLHGVQMRFAAYYPPARMNYFFTISAALLIPIGFESLMILGKRIENVLKKKQHTDNLDLSRSIFPCILILLFVNQTMITIQNQDKYSDPWFTNYEIPDGYWETLLWMNENLPNESKVMTFECVFNITHWRNSNSLIISTIYLYYAITPSLIITMNDYFYPNTVSLNQFHLDVFYGEFYNYVIVPESSFELYERTAREQGWKIVFCSTDSMFLVYNITKRT